MRLLALLLALSALPALASDVPPPPPPPPPPPGDAPTTADQPPPPPPSEAPVESGKRTNWAKTAAIMGFVAAGAVLVLNITNEFIGAGVHYYDPAGEFGWDSAVELVPLVITAVFGPVVYAGGSSARWTKSITGARGLRIVGWITYGVALFAQLISLPYFPFWRTVAGVIGAGSLVCNGVDALISASEAADVAEMASDDGVRLQPAVSIIPGVGGRGGGAMLSLTGAF